MSAVGHVSTVMTKCYATPGEAPQSTTDVVIVDPSPIWRRGLELLFDSHRSLRVAASVAKVDELRDEGDAAVVVLHQTGTDGGVSMWLAEVETLREARASLRVVGIHRGLDATSLRLAAAAGVDQLVDASSSEAVLLRAVCDPAQPSLRRWEGSPTSA